MGEKRDKKWDCPEQLGIHQRKQVMKELYTTSKRRQEIFCLSLAVTLISINFILFWRCNFYELQKPESLLWSFIALVFGIITADFASGVVHWGADSYLTIETPIVGKALIRPFREHHIDPTAMLNHDFVETNADTFALTIPFLIVSIFNFYYELKGPENLFWDSWLLSLCVFVSLTNEFHKLSHTHKNVPYFWKVLQDFRVILPPAHHRIHHVRPHSEYYCITTGWLDPILEGIGFWRFLEYLIFTTTGAKARDDDMKWTKMDKDKNLNTSKPILTSTVSS